MKWKAPEDEYIKHGDIYLGEFFSWKRRKIENSQIVWLEKVYVIYTFDEHARFEDYSTLDPKIVLGNRPLQYAGWVIHNAFSSHEAREAFLEDNKKQGQKNKEAIEKWLKVKLDD